MTDYGGKIGEILHELSRFSAVSNAVPTTVSFDMGRIQLISRVFMHWFVSRRTCSLPVILVYFQNRRARSVLFHIKLCSSVLTIKGLDAFIYGLMSRIELRRSEVSFLPQANG